MKRVLQIYGEILSNGGQEAYSMNMYRNINREKVQFDFYTPYYCDNENLVKEIEQLGGKVYTGGGKFELEGNKKDFVKNLSEFLSNNPYEIVHINSGSIFALAFGAKIAKKYGAKNIIVHFGHTQTNSLIGADGINHLYNAMEPMTHKKETLIIKALLDENIYTELIADTKHVVEDVLKLTFKIRPKNKILLISDALPIANSNLEKIEFCNKTVLKTGYDEKGILGGSVMLLPDIVSNLIKKGIITEEEANLMAYENQKNYLKLML